MIGSAIGSLVGPEGIPIGAMLGQQAGASIASIGGYGRYKIKKNTLMQQKPLQWLIPILEEVQLFK